MEPKVIYWDGPKDGLLSGKALHFESNDFFELDPLYKAFKTRAQKQVSLPFSLAAYVNGFQFEGAQELLKPEELLEEIESNLGLQNTQNLHEINSYIFTQHECPEIQASLKSKGNPQDWVVLLKVASIGEFEWWDAGELFFVIHKSDLAKRDFSQVYCGLKSEVLGV